MSLNRIFKLGDPQLYKISTPVLEEEIEGLKPSIKVMHDALMEFRENHGVGRAVAAPPIGVFKTIYLFKY